MFALGLGQYEEHALLGGPQSQVKPTQQCHAGRGHGNLSGAHVGGVALAGDPPGLLQVVPQVGHHGAVHSELVRKGQQAFAPVGRDSSEHLEAPWLPGMPATAAPTTLRWPGTTTSAPSTGHLDQGANL